eukprot:1160874-Pelagomonas_calceolata.AAC.8
MFPSVSRQHSMGASMLGRLLVLHAVRGWKQHSAALLNTTMIPLFYNHETSSTIFHRHLIRAVGMALLVLYLGGPCPQGVSAQTGKLCIERRHDWKRRLQAGLGKEKKGQDREGSHSCACLRGQLRWGERAACNSTQSRCVNWKKGKALCQVLEC